MAENHLLVSAIIPVYNGDRYLAEAIESVLQQTYQPIEVIVIDDGSTDNSADIARSYPEVRYLYQPNQGVAAARNQGIAEACGEFIAFLDQDDFWTPNKLSVQVDYLLEHPDIGYTLAKMRICLEPGTEKPSWLKAEYLSEDIPAYIVGALVVRQSILGKVGGFNPIYKFGNDSNWFLCAVDAGIPMAILPETLLYKRVHGANESYKVPEMTLDMLKFLRSSIHRKRNQMIARNAHKETEQKNDHSLISVIIPVYNGDRYLGEAIESVLAQTCQPIEIIVVDDGSTDGSASVAKSFGSSVHYCYQTNSGAGTARNRGIRLAIGNFFALLDADDLWVKDKLMRQMAAFDDDPELDIVFGQVKQFHSLELDENIKRKIHCPAELMSGYFPGTMLIKRDAFFRIGLFETNWKIGEFVDWYSRAIEQGLRSCMLPEVLLERRLHETNMGIRERQFRTDYARILKASLDRRRAKGQLI